MARSVSPCWTVYVFSLPPPLLEFEPPDQRKLPPSFSRMRFSDMEEDW